MRRRRLVLVLGAAVLAWASLAGWFAIDAFLAARRADRAVDAARASAAVDGVDIGRTAAHLEDAARALSRARSRLRSPVLVPVRVLPVAGRQLRTTERLAAAGEDVAVAGLRMVGALEPLIESGPGTGADRVRSVERAVGVLARARRDLAAVDPGPGRALVGPIRRRYDRFSADLAEARDTVDRATAAARSVASLLRGPRRYLVLAANNAEMRAGSGTFLSVGVLESDAGSLSLRDMRPSFELLLAEGEGVAMGGDLERLWGWLEPNREWRNLGITPRFDVTAELASRMWEARTGTRVDGVLAVDIEALAAVVAASGPVEVEGTRLDASQVVSFLLHDQYIGLDAESDSEQLQRRDRLSDIASEVVADLDAGGYDFVDLGRRLARAASGRHLMVWARDSGEQNGWRHADVAGVVGDDALLVALVNRGANKLDPFIDVSASLSIARDGRASIRMRVANRTPPDEPPYVTGVEDIGLAPGDYRGLLSVTLPGSTEAARITGPRVTQAPVARGSDGPSRVVAAEFEIPRGEETTFLVEFRLPGSQPVVVLPDARIPPIRWAFRGTQWLGSGAHVIDP